MHDCVFCRILARESPASLVYEDAVCAAFLDLRPVAPGHALVVPRRHATFLHELQESDRVHLFHVASRVSEAHRAVLAGWAGANVGVNDGPGAGQQVPHVHVHVVPRRGGDAFRAALRLALNLARVPGSATPRSRLDRMAERLRRELP